MLNDDNLLMKKSVVAQIGKASCSIHILVPRWTNDIGSYEKIFFKL